MLKVSVFSTPTNSHSFSPFILVSLLPVVRVRTMGSAALHMCQVAAGQGDVFFEFGIHCWDYAAATLIVTEAGGYCCDSGSK